MGIYFTMGIYLYERKGRGPFGLLHSGTDDRYIPSLPPPPPPGGKERKGGEGGQGENPPDFPPPRGEGAAARVRL